MQRTINLHGRLSTISTCDSLQEVFNYVEPRRTVVITDKNVERLYGRQFADFIKIVLKPGEQSKSLVTMQKIYRDLVKYGVDRGWTVLGLGGGVVCDVAGFTASTFLRGIDFGFVATTIMAQADASIGGKNGVNFAGIKNIIGTINQPRFVLCPRDVLSTLPHRHLLNGIAEIIKCGAIGDADLLAILHTESEQVLHLQTESVEKIVSRAINLKADIVLRDEREQNERRRLNFGHSIGHALEVVTGLLHGEAVAIGMHCAAAISVRLGYLSPIALPTLTAILNTYELPTDLPIAPEKIAPLIVKDKKRRDNQLQFVILRRLGDAQIVNLGFQQIREFLDVLYCDRTSDAR